MSKYKSDEYPKTKDEWWALVERFEEELRSLVKCWHPASHGGYKKRMPITAQKAEALSLHYREEIKEDCSGEPVDGFNAYLRDKDERMVTLLNQTWFGIPESMDCWELVGFGLLCDLCSESGVLEPETEESK